jgi:predicted cupin superfamily sugar epimerase
MDRPSRPAPTVAPRIAVHSEPNPDRVAQLKACLGLQPHPEGGNFREIFRSPATVDPRDGRPLRNALTVIDFLLARGEWSAWHRVDSDEAWHLLEGGPLDLWLVPPSLDRVTRIRLGAVGADSPGPRHVVAAGWWQAARAAQDYALVGATVGPGFDLADFCFARTDLAFREAITRLDPDLVSLL